MKLAYNLRVASAIMKKIMKDFFEASKYRISEASEFLWDCYGSNAIYLDSNRKSSTASLVFDSKNQTVYEVSVCDYKKDQAYKWRHPDFHLNHVRESKKRGHRDLQAWDDVDYKLVDLKEIMRLINLFSRRRD